MILQKGDVVSATYRGEGPELFIYDSTDRGFFILIDRKGEKIPVRPQTLELIEKSDEEFIFINTEVDMKGHIDNVLEKAISRKLLVFATATALLATSGLDSETWGMIAVFYIGGQSVVDAMKAYRHGGN